MLEQAKPGCRLSELIEAIGHASALRLVAQEIVQLQDAPRTADCVECSQPHVEILRFDHGEGRWFWVCPELGVQYAESSELDAAVLNSAALVREASRLLGFPGPKSIDQGAAESETLLIGELSNLDRTVFLCLSLETHAVVGAAAVVSTRGSKTGGWVVTPFSEPTLSLDRKHQWLTIDDLIVVDDDGLSPGPMGPPWMKASAGRKRPADKEAEMWSIFRTRRPERLKAPSHSLQDEASAIHALMPTDLRLAVGTIENRIRATFRAEKETRARNSHGRKRGTGRGRK